MTFEVEGEAPIDQPTAAQVDDGLRTLQLPVRTFAILALEDWTYIQTAFDAGETFVLELIGAFESYLRQDGAWRSGFQWERLEL
jgi:hypothetical protein